ncbi:hypothetical protein [Methylophaga pinxianii]|uniref:hypothetical protein n=1 Tax=Methylophaga pinxianii TaxID=2881052 RepID=UPI001CF103B3|nr:hypothetical protein [Methylophaga pinxianii]MCB2426782.1 hypothetical protein [Methylophaga pinxianii]UPH46547.1 hypothetical protein LGT42_004485 [Methylophaga pinxianii]
MTTEFQKKLALDQELFNAVRLIKAGLGQLQTLDAGNDFYHLPLLTLASGFERFMKVTFCFRWLEAHGSFPTSKAFPSGRNEHDLKCLLERIRTECFLDDYVDNIPGAKADVEYLNSKELLSFISVLSDFGQAARYYNLDVAVGRNVQTEDPDAAWQRLETEILLARKDLMDEITNNSVSNRVHIKINNEVVSRLERFARALARLYTIGKIGVEARRYLGYISYFLHLSDSDLGTKKYELSGSAL